MPCRKDKVKIVNYVIVVRQTSRLIMQHDHPLPSESPRFAQVPIKSIKSKLVKQNKESYPTGLKKGYILFCYH